MCSYELTIDSEQAKALSARDAQTDSPYSWFGGFPAAAAEVTRVDLIKITKQTHTSTTSTCTCTTFKIVSVVKFFLP